MDRKCESRTNTSPSDWPFCQYLGQLSQENRASLNFCDKAAQCRTSMPVKILTNGPKSQLCNLQQWTLFLISDFNPYWLAACNCLSNVHISIYICKFRCSQGHSIINHLFQTAVHAPCRVKHFHLQISKTPVCPDAL